MFPDTKTFCKIFLCIFCLDTYAFNLKIEPSISVSETHSDNINLADDGFEDDDFVTSVNPQITLSTNSRIHDSTLNYVLQKIHYINLDRTDTFNSLNTEGEFEFLKDHFFTEYNIKNGQQNISNTGALSSDNLSINNNRQNVLSYSVHPYWKQRISVYAFLEAGFEMNEIISDNNNSTSETITLNLGHGTLFNRILWDIDFSDETIENDFGNQTIFRNLTGNVRYLLTRKFAITTSVGYDDNKFQSSDSISGLLWNAGFEWNPSRRTSMSAAVGRRFFGTDYKLDISHTTKKTKIQVIFDQTPDTTRNNLLNQQVFNLNDIFGEVIINPETGLPANIDVLAPEQTTEVLINRKLRFITSYDYKKTFLSFELFTEQRDFQLSNDTEDSYGARINWKWQINPTLKSDLRFDFHSQDTRRGITNNQSGVNLRIIKNLTRDIDINGGLGHTIRDVESGNGSYKETRAFVGLTKNF